MSTPGLYRSPTDPELIKHFYSASLVNRAPSSYNPKRQTSTTTLPKLTKLSPEPPEALYKQVFLPTDQLQTSKPKKFRKNLKKVPKSSDFFYQLLFVDTPTFDSSLKDLLYIAELGIPKGDLRKEANICISLGDKYYELKKNISAIRFYKRALANYSRLKDLEGRSTAFNRLSIAYFVRSKLPKSRKMIKKHQEICDEDFVPAYNLGIVQRGLGMFKSSQKSFLDAENIAAERENREEVCLAKAQLGLTYKAMEEFEMAETAFRQAAKLAKSMKAFELMGEIKIALGYLNYFKGKLQECKKCFYAGMVNLAGKKSEICRVNIGILLGEEEIQKNFNNYSKK